MLATSSRASHDFSTRRKNTGDSGATRFDDTRDAPLAEAAVTTNPAGALAREAKNRPNIPLQEKFRRAILKGVLQNNGMKFLLGRAQ
jgi:hypothetical protein